MNVLAGMDHYVYRHYNANGDLLYVGITVNPTRRPWNTANRPWLADSVRCTLTDPMDRFTALTEERDAIRSERPLHNVRRDNGGLVQQARAQEAARRQRVDAGLQTSLDPDDPYGLSVNEAQRIAEALDAGLAAALPDP